MTEEQKNEVDGFLEVYNISLGGYDFPIPGTSESISLDELLVEFAQRHWISVEDRLPELPGDYLGYIANPKVDPKDHQIQVCYLSTRHGSRGS